MFYHKNTFQRPKIERYFKENNKEIIEAIVKDDVEALSDQVLGSEDSLNQEFGFDNYYLPRFISSAPPIISVAAFFNASNCFQFLLDTGADPKKKDLLGRTTLHFAMASKNLEIVRSLETALANTEITLNTADDNGNLPIHVACEFGFFDGVKHIYMNCGPKSLVAMNNSLSLPLLVAAYNGHLDIIKYFKDIGVNILDVDCNGLNALHYACAGGQALVAKYLIENGINIDRTGHDSDTPILYAAQNGNLETVKLLVESGSNKYRQKNAKRSPLIEAAKFGHVDVIKYFVSKGADINMRNSSGECVYNVATDQENFDVIKYLVKEQSMSLPKYKVQQMLSRSLCRGDIEFFSSIYKEFSPLTKAQADYILSNFYPSWGGKQLVKNQYKCLQFLIDQGVTFSLDAVCKLVSNKYLFNDCPEDLKDTLMKAYPAAFTPTTKRYRRRRRRW